MPRQRARTSAASTKIAPCAKSNGLPVGLMLTGRHFDDATLLRIAHAYEQNVAWDAA